MPSVIRNQQYAALRRAEDGKCFDPYPIDARDDEEAQSLGTLYVRSGVLKPPITVVKLLCDIKDGSGPDAIYVGKDE